MSEHPTTEIEARELIRVSTVRWLRRTHSHRDLVEHVHDRLGQYREVLEAPADLDTELSADAQTALEILDEQEDQE